MATAISNLAQALSSQPAPATRAPAPLAISRHQHQQPTTKITTSQASGPGASQDPRKTINQKQSEHDNSTSSTLLDPTRADSCSATSSPISFPTELTSSIPEESDEDSATVASRNEPITPVSGRQSSDFQTRDNDNSLHTFPSIPSDNSKAVLDSHQGPFTRNFQFPPESGSAATPQQLDNSKPAFSPSEAISTDTIAPLTAISHTSQTSDDLAQVPTQDRRPATRGSSSSKLKRNLSNMFSSVRKTNSQPDNQAPVVVSPQSYDGDAPERRWSMARSSGNTPQQTSPPSPTSPSDDGQTRPQNTSFLAAQDPPKGPLTKKNRASTGFGLRNRAVNFATGRNTNKPPRSTSFDAGKDRPQVDQMSRQVFYMNAEQGVGMKARRLSLSLPDDFQVDIGDLSKEFENQHKLFGRHRDGLGKGATAKVRVMARKGFPNELYAVKEFRGKTSSETKEEYEKKVKSEFSIAKSLHHPNVVETVRLCVDHGRWNHVMEYCSEGDLFSLIKKGHLMTDSRLNERLCLWKQLVQGLAYLHANGIAHRDVKLENLLITKDSKLKITDFGVSEVFSGVHPGARESGGECGKQMGEIRLCSPGICGSEPYIAPEVLAKKNKYDPRGLDVWGAGIVMIALLTGNVLWAAARPNTPGCEHYTALVNSFDKWNAKNPEGNPIFTELNYPHYKIFDQFIEKPALRRVLLMILNPDPDKRAKLDQVLAHRWVKSIECCQVESYDDPVVVIDATKKMSINGTKKIFCHNHLPPPPVTSHSLGKMPGQAGY